MEATVLTSKQRSLFVTVGGDTTFCTNCLATLRQTYLWLQDAHACTVELNLSLTVIILACCCVTWYYYGHVPLTSTIVLPRSLLSEAAGFERYPLNHVGIAAVFTCILDVEFTVWL